MRGNCFPRGSAGQWAPNFSVQMAGVMGLGEFSLIERYFAHSTIQRGDVALAVGDDAALVSVPEGCELVVSVDTLIAGCHFPGQTPPQAVGHKALAVNLSDLAAMGAEPAWATLALTLPGVDEAWLEAFSSGFFQLARHHQVQLIGGDTCRGPLSLTVQIMGWVPRGEALRRSGAEVGDLVYVTGQIGDAGLGLKLVQGATAAVDGGGYFVERLNRPTPRVDVGRALRGVASAAIDISDGLVADLGHILTQSGVGAVLRVEALPVAEAVKSAGEPWWQWPLTAGDDYELCFTVPAAKRERVETLALASGCRCSCIGEIVAGRGVRLALADGREVEMDQQGYRHFV